MKKRLKSLIKFNPQIIVGLGNPKKDYEKTYHNTGFLFIDYLISGDSAQAEKKSRLAGEKIKNFKYIKFNNLTLVKPLTFMNESGRAVKEALKYFSIRPENILIVHDDADIELGKYKLSFGSRSAGHQGVESVVKTINTKDFWRLRIGVRKNQKHFRLKAGNLVLKRISQENQKILKEVFQNIKEFLIKSP